MCGIVGIALRAGERPDLDRIARMISDVPFGAVLSVGIDFGLTITLMCRQGSNPVKTFTREFDTTAFDESRVATVVARHLGTDHRAELVTPYAVGWSIENLRLLRAELRDGAQPDKESRSTAAQLDKYAGTHHRRYRHQCRALATFDLPPVERL